MLSKYEIRSCGLQKFKEECKKIYENENFDRLIKLCGKYEYMSTMTSLAFRLVLDENGRIDAKKVDPIIYDSVTHAYWSFGEKVGQAFSDGKKIK